MFAHRSRVVVYCRFRNCEYELTLLHVLALLPQLVICPAKHCANGKLYTVVSGDSCPAIAASHTTDVAHVETVAGGPCPAALSLGQALYICPAGTCPNGKNYRAVAMDSCAKVATKFKVPVDHVQTANGSACPQALLIGDILVICPVVAASANNATASASATRQYR